MRGANYLNGLEGVRHMLRIEDMDCVPVKAGQAIIFDHRPNPRVPAQPDRSAARGRHCHGRPARGTIDSLPPHRRGGEHRREVRG